jgi:endo-1,3-1,4-beta-glycanase ExoK
MIVIAPANGDDQTGRSFYDKFDGFDHTRWTVSHGWTNGDYQNCTWYAGNVKLAKNQVNLLLNNERSPVRPYTCAEIQTNARYGYGTYEARMRSAAGVGLVSAFFTYTPKSVKWPGQDEIDFEFLGKDTNTVQLNYFANGNGEHRYDAHLDFEANKGANDYAFEWLPDSIRWYINGKLVHEVKKSAGELLPQRPAKIILSIWNGVGPGMEGWLGRFTYPGIPPTVTIEHVAFTAAGEPCQFEGSIVCKLQQKAAK